MCVCSQSSSLSLCVVRRPCKERSDLIAADWSHQFNQASPPLGTRHTLTPKSLACILIASASKENHGRQQKHCIKLSKLIIASIVHVWQRLSQEVPFHFLSIGNAICSHCSHICSIDDFFFFNENNLCAVTFTDYMWVLQYFLLCNQFRWFIRCICNYLLAFTSE